MVGPFSYQTCGTFLVAAGLMLGVFAYAVIGHAADSAAAVSSADAWGDAAAYGAGAFVVAGVALSIWGRSKLN